MATILIMDRETSRTRRLVTLSQRMDPALHIETFADIDPALAWLGWHCADLVIADSEFPEPGVGALIERVRRLPGGRHLPLLIMTPWGDRALRRKVLDAGATDFLGTPLDDLEFHARCGNLLTQRRQQCIIHERARWLERKVCDATRAVRHREHETLLRLARAGEYRDAATGNHVIRMARYARVIAEQLGLPEDDCNAIELAAPMHDIGKIGIPDHILRKPGRLTRQEFELMKTHTLIGHDILKDSPSRYLQLGALIALNHHEKFNGSGYPGRLGREDIPLPARIVSVADAYDALTSERPYKPASPMDRAIAYLREQRGGYFDPQCLDAFTARLDRISAIRFSLGDRERAVGG
jgi:two-component system response regulator RpfG